MCMSSRTQTITNPLGHLLINNKKTYHRCVCHQENKLQLIQLGHLLINNKNIMTYTSMICFCYLLTGALAGLVVACVLDDIHIYDMFFCYLLTGAVVD
jgi:hypothetical protein